MDMEYYLIFGIVAVSLIAIFAAISSVKKDVIKDREPLNELNITITELNTHFKHMLENDEVRDKRITKHGEEIDAMKERQRTNEKRLENHEYRIDRLEKEGE